MSNIRTWLRDGATTAAPAETRNHRRAHIARFFRSAAAVATAAVVGGGVLVASPAHATQEFTYPGAIVPGSVTVTSTSDDIHPGTRLTVSAEWSVPDGAVGGETFGMTLPAEFKPWNGNFSLPMVGDPSVTAATCVTSNDDAPVVVCTLTDAVNGLTGVGGTLWATVTADKTTDESAVEFVVDGEVVVVDLPGDGGIVTRPPNPIPSEPTLQDDLRKGGWQNANGTLGWNVTFPGDLFDGVETITVTDVLTPAGDDSAAHASSDSKLNVYSRYADGSGKVSMGYTGGWDDDGTSFTIDIDGPLEADRLYVISYTTIPTDGAFTGDRFRNTVAVNGETASAGAGWTAGGGGTGSGERPGLFSIEKVIAGDAADAVPADTAFTVAYRYGTPATTGTLTVRADGTVADGPRLAAGTVVVLSEVHLPDLDNVEWGAPVFSGDGVTANQDGTVSVTMRTGETVTVTLENTANAAPVVEPTPTPTPDVELPATDGEVSTETNEPTPALAATGGSLPMLAGGSAVLLLVAGATLLAFRKRENA